jgi:phosphatidylglycerophosphatase A
MKGENTAERKPLPGMGALPRWLVDAVATVFWLGRIGPAPGTIGSLAGTVFVALAFPRMPLLAWWLVVLLLFVVGVFFCDEAERRHGVEDPGFVILDEFAAMPIVFIGIDVPITMGLPLIIVIVAGFALFRLFDIAKPFGISRLQCLPGGFGIMVDDTAAALASCALLHLGLMVYSTLTCGVLV